MRALLEAIDAKYRGDTLANSLSGGMHNTEAPQDVVFPYGVCSLISVIADWTFGETFENCLVQFNLFSNQPSAGQVCDLFNLLITAFDFLDLVIEGYTIVSCVRENSILARVENVWQYNVLYRILLQKN